MDHITPAAPSSPFHPGERAVQHRVGVAERMEQRGGRAIRDFMPEQHRAFFPLLPFLPIALHSEAPWPEATILTGPAGFITAPDPRILAVAARPDRGDPAAPLFQPGAPIGALGIDLATRRRNRANGHIAQVGPDGFAIAVEQSFGNCAQYIQARELDPPAMSRRRSPLERLAGLDAPARRLIGGADTMFVASRSAAGLDISHRGGRSGFVRLNGDVLTIPDFAGNRYFNTLGNFVEHPFAALLFIDFRSGDLLRVAGPVEMVWEGAEVAGFRGAERLWRVRTHDAWRLPAALALRWTLREPAPTTLATGTWNAPAPDGGPAH